MKELAPGEVAPAFTLPRLDGTGEVTGPVLGPLTLLLFAKSSCPTCQWVLPFFQKLHEGTRGLHVLEIAEDDPDAERALAAELGLTLPIVHEASPWSTAEAYGLTTVPTFFLLDEDGRALVASAGFAQDELLDVARRAAERDGTPPADPFPEGEDIPPFRPG
jgi:peroxiredoxin